MDAVGVGLAVPPIFYLMLQLSYEGFRRLREVQSAGKDLANFQSKVDAYQHILLDWETEFRSFNASEIDAKRIETIKQTLSCMADIFSDSNKLEQRYGIRQLPPERASSQNTPSASENSSARRSARTSGSAPKKYTGPRRWLDKRKEEVDTDVRLNRGVISTGMYVAAHAVPALVGSSSSIWHVQAKLQADAKRYQDALDTIQRCRWSLSGKPRCGELVEELREHIDLLRDLIKPYRNKQVRVNERPTPMPTDKFKVPISLPFSRNTTFVGCEDVLKTVASQLGDHNSTRSTLVLCGMGGIGKSQIALEYAYEFYKKGRYSAIFWIDGNNSETAERSVHKILEDIVTHYASLSVGKVDYLEISKALGIPGHLSPETGMLAETSKKTPEECIAKWLGNPSNPQWLLILDNCDGRKKLDLSSFIPICGHGHILVTSRTRTICEELSAATLVEVPDFDAQSAIKLLLKCSGKSSMAYLESNEIEKCAAHKIIDQVGRLPLAISISASYIRQKGLRFAQYYNRLSEDPSRFLFRDFQCSGVVYPDGVVSCWRIAISELSKNAGKVLSVCGFLSNESIDVEMLFRGMKFLNLSNTENTPPLTEKQTLYEAIDNLVEFSLIKRRETTWNKAGFESLWIHPLLQQWVQEFILMGEIVTLTEETTAEVLERKAEGQQQAVSLVAEGIADDIWERKNEHWLYERRILPHIELCYRYAVCSQPELDSSWKNIDVPQKAIDYIQGTNPEGPSSFSIFMPRSSKFLAYFYGLKIIPVARATFRLSMSVLAWSRTIAPAAFLTEIAFRYYRSVAMLHPKIEDVPVQLKLEHAEVFLGYVTVLVMAKKVDKAEETLGVARSVVEMVCGTYGATHRKSIRSQIIKILLVCHLENQTGFDTNTNGYLEDLGQAESTIRTCLAKLPSTDGATTYDFAMAYLALGRVLQRRSAPTLTTLSAFDTSADYFYAFGGENYHGALPALEGKAASLSAGIARTHECKVKATVLTWDRGNNRSEDTEPSHISDPSLMQPDQNLHMVCLQPEQASPDKPIENFMELLQHGIF